MKNYKTIVKASQSDTTVDISVPDPVPVLTGNIIGFTQAAPVITQTAGPSDQNIVFKMLDTDYARPGAGANNFYGGNGSQTPLPFPYVDNDQRFLWKELQTGPASYNFGPLDAAINKMISQGGRLSFRVTTVDSGNVAYPSFIPSLATNQLDFNSELYLSTYEKFIAAMADHLNTTGLIKGVYKIDIGGIGNWSEMHWFSLTVPVITATNGKRIVDAWIKNFQNTWLMSTSLLTNNSSMGLELSRYILNAKNNLGPIGIRCDHLGWVDTFNKFDMDASKYYSSEFLSALKDRWKTSPICGELMNNLSGINPNSPYSDLINEINALHISQFSNNNFCRLSSTGASTVQKAASDNNIIAASKVAGARIGITSATVSGNKLTLNWVNNGNAPVYENWEVWLIQNNQLVKSIASLKGIQPGISVSVDVLQPGSYPLSIIITDPLKVRPPYPLQNTGRQTDGSYKIADVSI